MRRIFVSHRMAVVILTITNRNMGVCPRLILATPSINNVMLRIKLANETRPPEYKQKNGWRVGYGKNRNNRPPVPKRIKRGCRHK